TRRRTAPRSAAHDYSSFRLSARPVTVAACALAGRLVFSAQETRAIALLAAPARHGVEGGRGDRLTGPQAEAGVVPRASHGVADDQSFGERAAVMRACRADREQFVAAAGEQDS